MRVNGIDAVLLDAAVYEQLSTSRRQAGAQSAQIHRLKARLTSAESLLDAVAEAVAATADDECAVRRSVLDLLATRAVVK
ncbi:hypothetical protein AB0I60_02335 [Actinosynnema sp. NPDC050436]|uniref:hypothetical protein n=1 Tax=Actinosynnema sp. NPDC050436 TaxID=3155659 RepID=UPI0033BFC98A